MNNVKHSVAVVGCGYWGPNLLCNFAVNPRSRVSWLVGREPDHLRRFADGCPQVRRTTDLGEALKGQD